MPLSEHEVNNLIDELVDAQDEIVELKAKRDDLFAALENADLLILDLREDLRKSQQRAYEAEGLRP